MIPRQHGLLEARALDTDEVIHGIVVAAIVERLEGQQSRSLRHGLDDQHTGHHRLMRIVAGEIGFVDADILQCQYTLPWYALEHPIDHQHGITVRQMLQYLIDVHRAYGDHGFFSRALRRTSKSRILSLIASRCFKRAKFLAQLACS